MMIVYGKTVGGELASAGHTGTDAQALQAVLGPVHDAFAAVAPEHVSGDVTITIPRSEENGGPLVVTLCASEVYSVVRQLLQRDRSAVGAAGHVIE